MISPEGLHRIRNLRPYQAILTDLCVMSATFPLPRPHDDPPSNLKIFYVFPLFLFFRTQVVLTYPPNAGASYEPSSLSCNFGSPDSNCVPWQPAQVCAKDRRKHFLRFCIDTSKLSFRPANLHLSSSIFSTVYRTPFCKFMSAPHNNQVTVDSPKSNSFAIGSCGSQCSQQ